MLRFFLNAKRSLDSLLILITDLVTDGLLFFRLLFRSRTALSAEVLFLRKQLAFYQERQVQPRRLNDSARFSLIFWSRLCNWKEVLVIVKPETLIGWQRKSFQLFWKGKSQAGRPRIPENIRNLIVQMAQENPTWGQARVSAELSVKLGIYVSPRTVRAYWPPEPERRAHRRTSSQNWRTFVRNHAQSIVACDFLVVVTARFRTLYVFLLMEVGTRRIVHCNVTAHPTAAWTLQQLREAIPSDHSYRFLIHDRDSIPLGEKHLRRILAEWVPHYNQGRPHLSLGPGIPEAPAGFPALQGRDRHSFAQDCKVVTRAVLGGLHHEYGWERMAA